MSETSNRIAESSSLKDKSDVFIKDYSNSDGSFDSLFEDSDFDSNYLQKSRLVSNAIDNIGFGKYQIGLFFVAGFGWFSDNAWPVVTSLIRPRSVELNGVLAPTTGLKSTYLTLSQNLGLLVGALFWSFSADIIGRRWAFNLTFLIIGVFAVIAGSSPNFAAIGVYEALWSFGVGGNLPVDSAIFLEALPSSHQWLLTFMSIWWAFGQLVATLVAWGLIGNYSCADDSDCLKQDNKGWRYLLYAMGGLTLLMFIARFTFRVFESPKFHLSRGNNSRVVETLERIAKINGKTSSLTVEELNAIDNIYTDNVAQTSKTGFISNNALIRERLAKYNLSHIRECFGSRRLFISSSLVIFTWALIGLAFPLYNAFLPTYLSARGSANAPLSTRETYRNTLIVDTMGVPASIIAGILVELRIGRKGTLAGSLVLTGVFLFASTTAKTSNALLGWNCAFSFFSNIMYGVLYAYTPEVFPTKIRGTGVGLAASANRVFGVFAPVIATYANLNSSAPIFVSGALFLVSGVLVIFFPYEPRGKSSF